jgi:hypothetical protein
MHLIYRHAFRTVVFLGTGPACEPKVKLGWRTLFADLRKAHIYGEGEVLKEFKRIMAHPYFQRVWVLQEVGMSQKSNIIAYYNGSIIPWRKITGAGTLLGCYECGKPFQLLQLTPSVRRHEMLIAKWTTIAPSEGTYLPSFGRYIESARGSSFLSSLPFILWAEPRLTEFLQDSRFSLATDPRDKIYSLLNLFRISEDKAELAWLLTIDYAQAVAQVYTNAARYCVEVERTLEIICYKEGAPALSDIPSWVPDWTSEHLFPIHRIAIMTQYQAQFHDQRWPTSPWLPSLRSTSNKLPIANFSDDSKLMTLTGYKLGIVSKVSSIWQAPLDVPDLPLFHEWATLYTGDAPSEVIDLPFMPDPRPFSIDTKEHTVCDFWLRIGRNRRLKSSDSTNSCHTDHHTERQWRRSSYYRHRIGRGVQLVNQDVVGFFFFKDWLAMMLPYASIGRRVAATMNGYFLLVPPETKEGDAVFFFVRGGSLDFVVRKECEETQCELIGVAYVHGFFGVQRCWQGMERETVILK